MIDQIATLFVSSGKAVVIAAAASSVVEVLVAGERQSWFSRVKGFCFWTLYVAVGVFITLLTQWIMHRFALKPLVSLDLSWTVGSDNVAIWLLGYTLAPLAGLFVFDFFYYFFHRLQHAVPFLWRLHSTHHSIEELNAVNSYHHLSEDFLRLPFITIPMAFLISVSVPQVALTLFFTSILGLFVHANTKLRFGIFKYVLVEPRHHRIHHSIENRHKDKNFAAFFPVWDALFGTAYFPRKEEYPRTGLDYVNEPGTLKDYLIPRAPPSTDRKTLPDPTPRPLPIAARA